MDTPTVTSAFDLKLETLSTVGLERTEALAAGTELARRAWLARTDIGFCVLHYQDSVSILRDRRFHSALSEIRRMSPGLDHEYFKDRRPSILSAEGDEHLRLRRLVSPAFTPVSADRHRATMRRVIEGLVEGPIAAGRAEFVAEVCEPYPIPIICEVLGAPAEDWRLFSNWAVNIFKIFNGNLAEDVDDIQRASEEISVYVRQLIAERRQQMGPDLLSDLIEAGEDGDRLSEEELVMLAEAVLLAGTDTTRNQLACTMALFAEHPEEWAKLRRDPSLASKAVEESMRYLGAVRATVRVASEDIVYRDVLFPKGTFVTTQLSVGNRDPEVFSQPDEFDITAERHDQQLTFGSGIHRCLGAALARAELQEALKVLAERVAEVSLDGPVTWKPAAFGIWGPAQLPLRLVAA